MVITFCIRPDYLHRTDIYKRLLLPTLPISSHVLMITRIDLATMPVDYRSLQCEGSRQEFKEEEKLQNTRRRWRKQDTVTRKVSDICGVRAFASFKPGHSLLPDEVE